MKKVVVGIASGIFLLMLCGAFFQRHALACEFIPVMGYQQIHREVFVGSDLSYEHFEELVQRITSASQRITDVYGIPVSKPRIFITSDAETAAKWGANEIASMHRMPWRSCIVIGPKGQNINVISHEWLHAEIQHRVGFWHILTEIPVWFDEGAALSLDFRRPFLPENINFSSKKIIAVQNLRSAGEFFSGNIQGNYQAARMAVSPLIRDKSFFEDLERVSDGESFETVFLKANKSMQPSANAPAD